MQYNCHHLQQSLYGQYSFKLSAHRHTTLEISVQEGSSKLCTSFRSNNASQHQQPMADLMRAELHAGDVFHYVEIPAHV